MKIDGSYSFFDGAHQTVSIGTGNLNYILEDGEEVGAQYVINVPLGPLEYHLGVTVTNSSVTIDLGEELGALVGVGAFIGAAIGGLLGELVGGSGTPSAWADISYNSNGEFVVSNVFEKDGGDTKVAKALASNAATVLNGVVNDLIGGEIVGRENNQRIARFGIKDGSFKYEEENPRVRLSDKDANALFQEGVIKALDGL